MESDYRLRQDIDKIRESSDKIDIIENQLEGLDSIIDTKLEEYYNIDEIDEKIDTIIEGEIDLNNYVKKSEVTFEVILEDSGDMRFKLGLGD